MKGHNDGGLLYIIQRRLRLIGLPRLLTFAVIVFICTLLYISRNSNSPQHRIRSNKETITRDIDLKELDTDSGHFIQEDFVDKNLCVTKLLDSKRFQTQSIPENKIISFPMILEYDTYKNYQLCFARHKGHEHTFNFFLEDVSEGDCDMYLSAKEEYPSQFSSQWKSNNDGDDRITIQSTDEELRSSAMQTLFIAVTGKGQMNECKLNVEIRTRTL